MKDKKRDELTTRNIEMGLPLWPPVDAETDL